MWKWLDGKKTNAAAILTAVLALLKALGVEIPGPTQDFLLYLAGLIGGIGVAHRAQKAKATK